MKIQRNLRQLGRLLLPGLMGGLIVLLVVPAALAEANAGYQRELFVRKVDRVQALGDGTELAHPIGVRVGPEGFVWLADTGNGRVLKMSPQGALVMAVGRRGTGPGELMLPVDMAVDDEGFIYVADTMNHRIAKFDGDGGFVKNWGAFGEINGPHGIDVGPDGNIYLADTLAHRVLKFSPEGKLLRSWGQEGSGPGDLRFPHGIDVTPDGSVFVSDFLNHRVVKFSADGKFLDSWGELGSAPGQFHHPWGVKVDSRGNIWVMDMSNNRLQRISPDGSVAVHDNLPGNPVPAANRQTAAYTALEEEAWDDGDYVNSKEVALLESTSTTSALRVGAAGKASPSRDLVRVFVGHSGRFSLDIMEVHPEAFREVIIPREIIAESRIRGNALDLTVARRVTGLQAAEGPRGVGTRGNRASGEMRPVGGGGRDYGALSYPIAAKAGPSRLTYVADTGNHRIVVLNPAGQVVRTFGSFGPGRGQLNLPSDLAVDDKGNTWVADTMNDRVQVFSPSGEVLLVFGNELETRAPHGIALSHDGTVYVSDTLNHRVAHYDADGQLLGHIGSRGGGDGELAFPHGLAVNGKYLYIADFMNHRVVKTTLAGKQVDTWGEFGSAPGQFRHPWGVAVGPDEDVWVGDMTNSRLQRFTANGNLVGVFGSYGNGLGEFDHPKGIDVRRDSGELVVGIPGLHAVDFIRGDVGQTSEKPADGSETVAASGR